MRSECLYQTTERRGKAQRKYTSFAHLLQPTASPGIWRCLKCGSLFFCLKCGKHNSLSLPCLKTCAHHATKVNKSTKIVQSKQLERN
jgi:hypothetical protein